MIRLSGEWQSDGLPNQVNENLPGRTRYGAGGTTPDEYGKRGGQDVKRGVANHTPIVTKPEFITGHH